MDHPVCNVMELDLALAITLTQEQYALLVNVVKEKLWCPAFLTAFVKVSNTSNECFQNSPFFSSHCYWVYHTTIAFWQKLKKKNIVLQKDNKYCHTESISKYISNNFWCQIAIVILMGLLVSNVMNMEYVIVWRVPQETSVMEHPLALCQYCHLYVCSIASLHENYYLDCNYYYLPIHSE